VKLSEQLASYHFSIQSKINTSVGLLLECKDMGCSHHCNYTFTMYYWHADVYTNPGYCCV